MSLQDDVFKEVVMDEDEEEEEEDKVVDPVEEDEEDEGDGEEEEEEEDEEAENDEADEEEDEEDVEMGEDAGGAAGDAGGAAKGLGAGDSDEKKTVIEKFHQQLLLKARLATGYTANPTTAIPHSCGINALCLPASSKWLFTGGEDGFIRKYDFFQSVDGNSQLTSAQRHNLVDSVSNAGVLLGYWANECPVKKSSLSLDAKIETYEPQLSPVYSLAVQAQSLWLLSGLNNGGVNLQNIRYNEGTIFNHFKYHKSTVSVLQLNHAEDKYLSGSWDQQINCVDLNTGKLAHSFDGSTGQITAIEYRPTDCAEFSYPVVKDDDLDSLFGDDDATTSVTNGAAGGSSAGSTSDTIFMSSSIDGAVSIWDDRMASAAIKLKVPVQTPPWCVNACWSIDGDSVFVGRRNSTVDEISIRKPFNSNNETVQSNILKFPQVSGAVTVVRPLPNGQHLLCASHDNIRIYDLKSDKKKTPFLIVPGHHGGVVSECLFDPTYRYMISASGNRGWQGNSTDLVFMYEMELMV